MDSRDTMMVQHDAHLAVRCTTFREWETEILSSYQQRLRTHVARGEMRISKPLPDRGRSKTKVCRQKEPGGSEEAKSSPWLRQGDSGSGIRDEGSRS